MPNFVFGTEIAVKRVTKASETRGVRLRDAKEDLSHFWLLNQVACRLAFHGFFAQAESIEERLRGQWFGA